MIIITRHAEERIKERTKLSLDSVKSILDSGACCPLGKKGSGIDDVFLLFYSQPDRKYFIAVLTVCKTYLKTVLHETQKVSVVIYGNQKKAARKKYLAWFFRHNVIVQEKIPSKFCKSIVPEKPVKVILQVYVLEKLEFSHELGELLLSKYPSVRKVISQHKELFENVSEVVNAWSRAINSGVSVKYKFCVARTTGAGFDERFTFFHTTLQKNLDALS